jgi:hypothetical protein
MLSLSPVGEGDAPRSGVPGGGLRERQVSFQGYRDTANVTQHFIILEPEDAKPLIFQPSSGVQKIYGLIRACRSILTPVKR